MDTRPIFTHDRPAIDLNGAWKFCPDPMQRARHQSWWRRPSTRDSIWPCWDVEGLWDIQVPGTWKTQFEELKWYDGHATYLRDFDAEVPAGCEAFLCFDAVVYAAEVWLNGQLAGRHDWGYSPFALRVTDILRAKNRMFVLVDNNYRRDRVPAEIFDWNNDGGIIGPVRLVFVPRTFVENFRVETRLDGPDALISVTVELASRDALAREEVAVRIPDLAVSATVAASVGAQSTAELRVPLSRLTLWSPETPRLYRVEVSTRFETVADDVGLREVRADGRNIMLNGKPLRLYGICVHAEFPGTGRTATPEGIRRFVDAAKDLGLNFFRCAHYPYSEAWGRAMDQAGVMWWEEVPAYWIDLISEETPTRLALGMMRETIRRDWNRASLVIWSVSNECCHRDPDDPGRNNYPYWFAAVEQVRGLDHSRLVSCAEAQNFVQVTPVWSPTSADEFHRRTDEIAFWRPGHSDDFYALFDVLAANFYVKAEESLATFSRFAELLAPYGKPLMLSEFGSVSLLGADVPDDEIGSEVRHSRLLEASYQALAQVPGITGYCPWCLIDIRCPIHWRWYNLKKSVFRYGILDEEWKRKKPYATLKEQVAMLKESLVK